MLEAVVVAAVAVEDVVVLAEDVIDLLSDVAVAVEVTEGMAYSP